MGGARDRTAEFLSTATSFENLFGKSKSRPTPARNLQPTPSQGEPSTRVSRLSQSINTSMDNTLDQIKQLWELSDKSSNFRDERAKIYRLTTEIKGNMDDVKMNVESLSQYARDSFDSGSDFGSHHIAIANILKVRLAQLAKDFAATIQHSTQRLQKQKAPQKSLRRQVARNRYQRPKQPQSDSEEDEKAPLMASHDLSQVMIHQRAQFHDQQAEEVTTLLRGMNELSQMYEKFGEMVYDQRRHIVGIHENIDGAHTHAEEGIKQLEKYLNSLQGNKWLMIKIFAVIIFFAIFFTLFVA